jgi:hypothetical protein
LAIAVLFVATVAMVVVAAVGGNTTTSATATPKVAGSGGGNNPALEFTGCETCADATVIPSIPYTDDGTTIGAVNDYDPGVVDNCPYTGSTAPDVVYQYTPATNESIFVSLCTPGTNTDYDTKLYIYEAACTNPAVACADDACSAPLYASFVSELGPVALTAGTTYYIVVDGYGSSSGNYTLSVEPYVVQTCPCPPDADLNEGTLDPLCGNDPAGDPTGGCNTDPDNPGPYMVQIACNTTICGTTSTYTGGSGDSRDTDWFELNLPVADTIRVTLTSESHLYLFDLTNEYVCASVGVGQIYEEFGNCAGSGEMVIAGVAGPNWIWVGPTVFGAAAGIECPSEYILTVTCDSVPVDLQTIIVE